MANWDDVAFEFHCAQPTDNEWPSPAVYSDFLKRYPSHAHDLEQTMMILVWWAWCAEHFPPRELTPEEEAAHEKWLNAVVARGLRKCGLKPYVVE